MNKEDTSTIENRKDIVDDQSTEIPQEEFSSEEIETVQTSNIENDRRDIENSRQIDKPFYLSWYFLISVSIISASLNFYYWDNITELYSNLINKIKDLKPGDSNTGSIAQTDDVIEHVNLNNISSIPESYLKLSEDTLKILSELRTKIGILILLKGN